ncbi:hypothetical protein [Streptomyces sp. NPDC058255]|uniref:hypothetical protein n=1 Tax=Streptomyces sp. NPDC058255 TaxID=3346407 RepID=UPI0036E42AB1
MQLTKGKKLPAEIYNYFGERQRDAKEYSRLVTVTLVNDGDKDGVINKVGVELQDRLDLQQCAGPSLAAGYATTHYSVIIPLEWSGPTTIEAHLGDGYAFTVVAGGKADALDISIGPSRAYGGEYPKLFKLRVLLNEDGARLIRSDQIVIASTDESVDEAIAGHKRLLDPFQDPGMYPGDRDRALQCSASYAEQIEDFIRDVPYVAPPVNRLRKELGHNVH